jgi:hypothetical protein
MERALATPWRHLLHEDLQIEPLVRVVGENPDTVPTAVLEDGHLTIAIDRPAVGLLGELM